MGRKGRETLTKRSNKEHPAGKTWGQIKGAPVWKKGENLAEGDGQGRKKTPIIKGR